MGSPHLIHVDFAPDIETEERFDSLVVRANQWLTNHPGIRVITAETSDIKYKPEEYVSADPNKTTYTLRSDSRMRFVRSLRFWVTPSGNSEEVQQIGHYNIIPSQDETCVFEDFSQMLDRLNDRLKTNPIPGRVLNLETLEVKYHTGIQNVDPNECYWENTRHSGTRFIHILRIFFVMEYPLLEEIGFADFRPQVTDEGEGYASIFEPLGHVIDKAAKWIKQHPDMHVVSVQSVNYKMKGSAARDHLNTHRTMHFEGPSYTKYLRIIRVGYVVRNDPAGPVARPQPVTLTYKNFMPCSLSIDSFAYEGFSEMEHRINQWLRHTAVDILSVETVPVRMDGGRQRGDPDVVYTRIHGESSMPRFLKVIRCYFNGNYTEPPTEALPPSPVESIPDDCCSMS